MLHQFSITIISIEKLTNQLTFNNEFPQQQIILEEEPEEFSTKELKSPKEEGRIFVGNNKVNKFIDKFDCNKITYKPALGYTPKKSAIMDLSTVIKSTIKKGGINTSEELYYF
ncbi:hypothetical protein MJO28_017713 [Puccinia striiformis f. sp. tritici]|nr:hypothetical protein MJO28_017713 [Puccinia striiformis f. sp. tritici]